MLKPTIARRLKKALLSDDYILRFGDPDCDLVTIMPDGSHEFTPLGVLCDIAPVEVCDWGERDGRVFVISRGDCFYRMLSFPVDRWAGMMLWRGLDAQPDLKSALKWIDANTAEAEK